MKTSKYKYANGTIMVIMLLVPPIVFVLQNGRLGLMVISIVLVMSGLIAWVCWPKEKDLDDIEDDIEKLRAEKDWINIVKNETSEKYDYLHNLVLGLKPKRVFRLQQPILRRLLAYWPILLALLVLLIVFCCLRRGSLINLFPLFAIVFLTIFYGHVNNPEHLHGHDCKSLKPLIFKATWAITLISIIFSLQSTLLAAYDSNKPYENWYKWFSLENSFKFPVEQIEARNDTIAETNTVVLKDYCTVGSQEKVLDFIAVDETLSSKEYPTQKNASKNFDEIFTPLFKGKTPDSLLTLMELKDKLAPAIVNQYIDTPNNYLGSYCIAGYFGSSALPVNDTLKQLYPVNRRYQKFYSMSDLRDTCIKKIDSIVSGINTPVFISNHKTHIDSFMYQIYSYLKNKEFDSFDTIRLHIISDFFQDFEDSSKITDSAGLGGRFGYNFSNLLTIKSINAGIHIYTLHANPSKNNTKAKSDAQERWKIYFLNAIKIQTHGLSRTFEIDFDNPNNQPKKTITKFKQQNPSEINDKASFDIKFYNPQPNVMLNDEGNTAKIIIQNKGSYKSPAKYFMTLTCDAPEDAKDEPMIIERTPFSSASKQAKSLLIRCDQLLSYGDGDSINNEYLVQDNDTLLLSFAAENTGAKHYYLNFYDEKNEHLLKKCKVKFCPLLSLTTSLYLIFFYIILITSVSLIIITLSVLYFQKKVNLIATPLLQIPVFLVVFSVAYSLTIVSWQFFVILNTGRKFICLLRGQETTLLGYILIAAWPIIFILNVASGIKHFIVELYKHFLGHSIGVDC